MADDLKVPEVTARHFPEWCTGRLTSGRLERPGGDEVAAATSWRARHLAHYAPIYSRG
jgi:hypothetical protein